MKPLGKSLPLAATAAAVVLWLAGPAGASFAQSSAAPQAPPLAPPGTPNGTVEIDRNGDGVIDYRVVYDRRGAVSREEMDFNYDGVMDTFYYYANGVLQREEIDSNNDGKIDIWVYLVDGTYVLRYERDTDGDGKPDFVRDFSKG